MSLLESLLLIMFVSADTDMINMKNNTATAMIFIFKHLTTLFFANRDIAYNCRWELSSFCLIWARMKFDCFDVKLIFFLLGSLKKKRTCLENLFPSYTLYQMISWKLKEFFNDFLFQKLINRQRSLCQNRSQEEEGCCFGEAEGPTAPLQGFDFSRCIGHCRPRSKFFFGKSVSGKFFSYGV